MAELTGAGSGARHSPATSPPLVRLASASWKLFMRQPSTAAVSVSSVSLWLATPAWCSNAWFIAAACQREKEEGGRGALHNYACAGLDKWYRCRAIQQHMLPDENTHMVCIFLLWVSLCPKDSQGALHHCPAMHWGCHQACASLCTQHSRAAYPACLLAVGHTFPRLSVHSLQVAMQTVASRHHALPSTATRDTSTLQT